MEDVLFLTNQDGDDLIVSSAIECSDDPGGVKSLILLRTSRFEFALEDTMNVGLPCRMMTSPKSKTT